MNFKSFKSLANYLDNVEAINSGGCGYSAFFIYRFFKEKGKNPEIAFIYDGSHSNYDNNTEIIENHNNSLKPSSAAHVVIKVGELAYDSTGAHKWEDTLNEWSNGNEYYHIVPEEFLIKALENKRQWNSWFDRDQEVPEMEKKIGINLPSA